MVLYRLFHAEDGALPIEFWIGGLEYVDNNSLSTAEKTAVLGHGGVLLLESLTKTFRALEEFVDTAHDAAFFLGVDLG